MLSPPLTRRAAAMMGGRYYGTGAPSPEDLAHDVILSSPNDSAKIESLGIITGGANGAWIEAHRAGLDAYLTGEMSEHDWHEAKESGVHMFAGGHNATEAFGVQDLMTRVSEEFPGLETVYLASPNPA